MSRRGRKLSSDEQQLWDRVAERTIPLDSRPTPASFSEPDQKPKPKKLAEHAHDREISAAKSIRGFRVGEKATPPARHHDLARPIADHVRNAPLHMDARAFGKMTRGKLKPDARIDLHGMTIEEAHPALISFVLGAHDRGHRLVLVITGKGKDRDAPGPIPARLGVLRHQVPQWLSLPPLRHAVLQVTPAHQRHGGHGAYYVYLRRRGA